MSTWNSRGLRGSVLEDLINRSNEIYLEKGLALIQKIPTPITPIQMDKQRAPPENIPSPPPRHGRYGASRRN